MSDGLSRKMFITIGGWSNTDTLEAAAAVSRLMVIATQLVYVCAFHGMSSWTPLTLRVHISGCLMTPQLELHVDPTVNELPIDAAELDLHVDPHVNGLPLDTAELDLHADRDVNELHVDTADIELQVDRDGP